MTCDKCRKPANWTTVIGGQRMTLCPACKIELAAYAQLVIDAMTEELETRDLEMVQAVVKANKRRRK